MRFRPRKYSIPDVMLRERILEAAFFAFGEKGFHDTRVETITKRAGIDRIVFYTYFRNKTEVLICLLDALRSDLDTFLLDRRCHKIWLNSGNIDTFQQTVIYLSKILADSSGVVRAVVQGMLMDKQLFLLFSDFLTDVASIFEGKIRSMQNNGNYPGCRPDIYARIMAVALIMTNFSATIGAFQCSIEQLAKQLSIFYFAFLNFNTSGNRPADTGDPTHRKSYHTKQAILDAARKMIPAGKGAPVTIAAIAKQAGISRSTVYLHFTKKEEIVKALTEDPGPSIYYDAGVPADNPPAALSEIEQKIMEAAKEVFTDQGYINATIEIIAVRAGCSRNTIYKYFQGKDGIIRAIFDEMFGLFHPAIQESDSIIDQTDTTRFDSIVQINSLVIDIFEKYADSYRALLQGALQSDKISRKFIEIYERIDIPLQRKIKKLQQSGRCRAVNPIVASRIMQTYQAHSIWMFHAGIIPCTRQELVTALSRLQFAFLNFG